MKWPAFAALAGLGALAALVAGCARDFVPVELTKEELVSLYEVPIDKKPAYKFHWNLGSEKHLRFVVEESNANGAQWRVRESIAYDLPVRQALLIFMIDQTATFSPGGTSWFVDVRLGGESGLRRGWSGSRLRLPAPDLEYTAEQRSDPERLYLVKFADRQFRFRIEASDHPTS